MLLSKTIRLFLDSIGRREEYEFYLERFQAAQEGCFTLLCPDADSIMQHAELIAFDMAFLYQLPLRPLLILSEHEVDAQLARLEDVAEAMQVVATPQEALAVFRKPGGPDPFVVLPLKECSLDEAFDALMPGLCKRIHFLRTKGALTSTEHQTVWFHAVNKPNHHTLHPDALVYETRAKQLLDREPRCHVSVTSPLNLLKELFTVKGAGTILRVSDTLVHFEGAQKPHLEALKQLLENSFQRTLKPTCTLEDASHYIIEEQYRGAAVLYAHPAGMYLSKFVVDTEARGVGLAQEIWQEIYKHHAAFFWRSRSNNPINNWYVRKADGFQRCGTWYVYWKGVAPENLLDIIAYCTQKEEDFIELK